MRSREVGRVFPGVNVRRGRLEEGAAHTGQERSNASFPKRLFRIVLNSGYRSVIINKTL